MLEWRFPRDRDKNTIRSLSDSKRFALRKFASKVGFATWVVLSILVLGGTVSGMERVLYEQDGVRHEVEGQVIAADSEGGLVLRTVDNYLWIVEADQVIERTTDEREFEMLDKEALAESVLAGLPSRFEVHQTAHYTICYDTSQVYARWCGSLFERLYSAFTNFWRQRDFEIEDPEHPLVAIVFANRQDYIAYSRPILGDAAESIVAYYNLCSNRLIMYDMTGRESRRQGESLRSYAEIQRILATSGAAETVATTVHEATHQLGFNCGLHQRFSDCPRWALEGVAIYFETPDLSSTRGWRSIGTLNRSRLGRFQRYASTMRPADSLLKLVVDDDRFLDTSTALDAYSEAWSLTYFLLRRYPDKYLEYMELLSEKQVAAPDTPEQRWADFRSIFGESPELARLDQDFLRFIMQMR
jgi:hypothetical protein